MHINSSISRTRPLSDVQLPDPVWQQISGHLLSAGQGRNAVEHLQSAMRALPGLPLAVEQDPTLKRFFLLHKDFSHALYHDQAHLRSLGMDQQRLQYALSRRADDADMYAFLHGASIDKLSSEEQTALFNKVRYNPNAQRRLEHLCELSRKLPQLDPDLRREVVHTLLQREKQDLDTLLCAQAAQRRANITRDDRNEHDDKLRERTGLYREALKRLLGNVSCLTPHERNKVFEQVAANGFELTPSHLQQLASAASELTHLQRTQLFDAMVGSARHRSALAAGIEWFTRDQVDKLIDSTLQTHRTAADGGRHICQVVTGMGSGITRIGKDAIQPLFGIMSELEGANRSFLHCALAPMADEMSKSERDSLVDSAAQIEDAPALRAAALTALCQNITKLSDRQQNQLVRTLTSDSRRDDSIARALETLGEHYAKLSESNQQCLLTVASGSSLSSTNRLSLITGMGKGFSHLPGAAGVRLPWEALKEAARSRTAPDKQDKALQAMSDSLNVLLNKHLAEPATA